MFLSCLTLNQISLALFLNSVENSQGFIVSGDHPDDTQFITALKTFYLLISCPKHHKMG